MLDYRRLPRQAWAGGPIRSRCSVMPGICLPSLALSAHVVMEDRTRWDADAILAELRIAACIPTDASLHHWP